MQREANIDRQMGADKAREIDKDSEVCLNPIHNFGSFLTRVITSEKPLNPGSLSRESRLFGKGIRQFWHEGNFPDPFLPASDLRIKS